MACPHGPSRAVILGAVIGGEELVALSTASDVYIVVGTVVVFIVAIVIATMAGRRWGRRAISQRLTSLGSRLGLDPPEDESNIETALAYLEHVTGGAAQSVAESSSDAIRLRRSLDTLTQGVVLCDENGSVIYRNGRANALMVSRHGDALAAQAVTELLEGAWHEGTAERTLDLYGPPRRTLQVRARQIDDGRRPLGVIALIEDISERRRLEEIRRDFVANVSHELKTPIGALGLLAETLVAEPDAEVAQRLAGRIHNEAFRVSRIIDDLLDLSRIESEEAPSREPVLVNLVMADAIERVRSTADQRGIEIVLHEPSPPIAVVGERRQLVSAMHALLENAITYSYDDSKVVVTGTVRRATANANLGQPALSLPEPVEAAFTPDTLADDGHPRPDAPHSETPHSETTHSETTHSETTWPASATSTTGPVPLDGEPNLGGVEGGVVVRSDWRSEEREHVRLSVQDSGIGIPARDLDRIFERFYRVDHGRSRDTGGTGLGLSIVRHVANNHQGWVDVESREGEGSTFSLVLPLHTDRLV
jgi:two-component system sensor histidine kinase SenX3